MDKGGVNTCEQGFIIRSLRKAQTENILTLIQA
jgi:hypothetical protein